MTEEERERYEREKRKQKYRKVIEKLQVISSKIDALDSSIYSLRDNIKNNIAIDGKGVEEDNSKKINETLKSVSSSINGDIIPSLRNNI